MCCYLTTPCYKFVGGQVVSAANSIRWHKETILNFFDNRTTNASAESFNARIKLFRANQKGVRDTTFFLFRLSKLYA
jgi:transposase